MAEVAQAIVKRFTHAMANQDQYVLLPSLLNIYPYSVSLPTFGGRAATTSSPCVPAFSTPVSRHQLVQLHRHYFVKFSTGAEYIGRLSDDSFDSVWAKITIGGGTRVMTVKELHFKKHGESATHHPVL